MPTRRGVFTTRTSVIASNRRSWSRWKRAGRKLQGDDVSVYARRAHFHPRRAFGDRAGERDQDVGAARAFAAFGSFAGDGDFRTATLKKRAGAGS